MRKFALRRPSPALAVSVVALLVALGGTAYAGITIPKNSVGTKQLKSRAVTTKKITNGAVTKSKINTSGLTVPNALFANSAGSAATATNATNAGNANTLDHLVSSAFLQTSSRGVGVGAARVTDTGAVLGYFNRNGGAPTVTHTATGSYEIAFPGIDLNVNTQILQATLVGDPGEVAVDSLGGHAIVKTFNSAGAATDKQFTLVAFPASGSG